MLMKVTLICCLINFTICLPISFENELPDNRAGDQIFREKNNLSPDVNIEVITELDPERSPELSTVHSIYSNSESSAGTSYELNSTEPNTELDPERSPEQSKKYSVGSNFESSTGTSLEPNSTESTTELEPERIPELSTVHSVDSNSESSASSSFVLNTGTTASTITDSKPEPSFAYWTPNRNKRPTKRPSHGHGYHHGHHHGYHPATPPAISSHCLGSLCGGNPVG